MSTTDGGKFFIAGDCDCLENRFECTEEECRERWLAMTAIYVTDKKIIAEKLMSFLEERQKKHGWLRSAFKIVDATDVESMVERNADHALAFWLNLAKKQQKDLYENQISSVRCIWWMQKEEDRIRKLKGLPKRPTMYKEQEKLPNKIYEELWKYLYLVLDSKRKGVNMTSMEFTNSLESLGLIMSQSSVSRHFNALRNQGYIDLSPGNPVILTEKGLKQFRQLLQNEHVVKEMAEFKLVLKPNEIDEELNQFAVQVNENAESPPTA